jgi:hypothetical protein
MVEWGAMPLPRTFAGLLLLPPLALAACGGGTSDKDELTKIIQDGGKDPATICDHLAPALLKQFGSLAACRTAAKAGDDGKDAVSVKTLTIDGDKATAKIDGARGAQTITFDKQDGDWVVTQTT